MMNSKTNHSPNLDIDFFLLLAFIIKQVPKIGTRLFLFCSVKRLVAHPQARGESLTKEETNQEVQQTKQRHYD